MRAWRVMAVAATVLAICACAGASSLPPAPTPDLHCFADTDCVLAIRLDRWCDCPSVYNKTQVEQSPSLLLMPQGHEYSYPTPRTTARPAGSAPLCVACGYVLGAVCSDASCKLPETYEETLRLCPNLTEPDRTNCYGIAATRAIEHLDVQAARDTCYLLTDNAAQQTCLEAVYWYLLANTDPIEAVDFCREQLPAEQHSVCLKTAAEALAETDAAAGIGMCQGITIANDNDQWQQDACFHNIAGIVARTDPRRAIQLCELISDTTSVTQKACREAVRINSPTATPSPNATTTPTARVPASPLPTPQPRATPTPTSVG